MGYFFSRIATNVFLIRYWMLHFYGVYEYSCCVWIFRYRKNIHFFSHKYENYHKSLIHTLAHHFKSHISSKCSNIHQSPDGYSKNSNAKPWLYRLSDSDDCRFRCRASLRRCTNDGSPRIFPYNWLKQMMEIALSAIALVRIPKNQDRETTGKRAIAKMMRYSVQPWTIPDTRMYFSSSDFSFSIYMTQTSSNCGK